MDIRKLVKDLLDLAALPKGEGLAGFTEDQLKQARDTAREIASYAKDARNVDDLRNAVEAFEAISTELTARAEAAAELEADLEALSSRIVVEQDDEGEGEGDAGEGDGEGEGEGSEEVVVQTPEPVTAAPAPEPEKPKPASVEPKVETPAPEPVKVEAPAVIVPEPSVAPSITAASDAPITLTAAGDVQGVSAGQVMKTELVASAMHAKAESVARSRTNGRYPVGRMDWLDGYKNADRFLSEDDPAHVNDRKIAAVVAAAQEQTRDILDQILAEKDPTKLAALTAAGGLCAPVNVRYELFTVGTTARPLRDSLTRFGASRGGITHNPPPVLADLAGSDAVNIYTEDDDTNSTGYPKGCLTVECSEPVTTTVDAITLCMIVGNYSRMFNPERFNATWGLGRVQHARIAEDKIWDTLDTLSTNVTAGEGLGATPDTLAQVERAAAQYRDRHRIDPSTPLRLRAPAFLRNILRVDLARRMPGDNTLAVSDGEIARFFAVRGIAVTWTLEAGQVAGGTSGYPQAGGALNPWPSVVDVHLSIDGTFLFLDGGSLDFGTEIRDFNLIRTNDTAAFMETFENVAFVGPEALMISLNICPDGSSGGTDEDAISCVSGS